MTDIKKLEEGILNMSITPSNIGDAQGRKVVLDAARAHLEHMKGLDRLKNIPTIGKDFKLSELADGSILLVPNDTEDKDDE